jgi:mRNA interferase RelE/StbE
MAAAYSSRQKNVQVCVIPPQASRIARTATKQITKLDHQAKKATLHFLRTRLSPADNRRLWGRALQGEKRGLWRYRVGDYRLICDIQDEKITILVLELGHRKAGYC